MWYIAQRLQSEKADKNVTVNIPYYLPQAFFIKPC